VSNTVKLSRELILINSQSVYLAEVYSRQVTSQRGGR